MRARRFLSALVELATRRPRATLTVVGVVALLAAAASLRLEPSADTDTVAGRGTDTYQTTERYRQRFGDHAVLVLVRGDLQQIVLTKNLGRLLALEGCLSGNLPRGTPPPGGPGSPCAQFAREKPVQVVYGPGTFVNVAVGQLQDQFRAQQKAVTRQAARAASLARRLARRRGESAARQRELAAAARQAVLVDFARDAAATALRYGLRLDRLPQLNDPDFVAALVFDPARGASVPKARFAYLFPNERSATIQVRLKPSLTAEERERAIELIRAATEMPQWRLEQASYTVTGAPVFAEGLTDAITRAILLLLIASALVMAATLALVFRGRPRLLPLAVALAAAALTFGAMALAGLPLTLASIAVLPVLVGLGVDYAIQYQSRLEEERRGGGPGGTAAAARRAAVTGVPTIATAGLATAVGFVVLLASPIPMVRNFGLLLVVGIVLALACALTAGTAALVLAERGPARHGLARAGRGAVELAAPPERGVARLLSGLPGAGHLRAAAAAARAGAARAARATLRAAVERPGRVLAVGALVAALGWVADTRTSVVADLRELVPRDEPAVRDLLTLQDVTGVAGEVDVLVESDDLTDPAVVKWMRDYQSGLLQRFKYSSQRGCGRAALCPALSLTDLFRSPAAAGSREQVRQLLDIVPPYFSQAVITPDRKTANLAFGIRLMPLERQSEVIAEMRRRLDPPPGVSARLAGLPVLAVEANDALSSTWRRLGTGFAGLVLVGLVLLAVLRRPGPALVPLIPIALATGWSALLLWLMAIPLNPLSAMLGALVIAISTEFSVLLSARYRQEREHGHAPAEALARTYRSTGAAVLASGVTAIAGFAVLVLSDIRMLRDFGLVTVVDLGVSLLGVLAVLPAVLVLHERGELRALPGRALAPLRRRRGRRRRPLLRGRRERPASAA